MSTEPANLDPVAVEVIRNGLAAAAREMNRTLVRTAFNPLLYEVQDFGLGIVSADGRLWAEAPGIAGFISALSDTVRSGLAMVGPRGFREGDLYIVNDPYLTGTHISDTSVYAPVFHAGHARRVLDRDGPLGRHRREDAERLEPRHDRRLPGGALLPTSTPRDRGRAERRPPLLDPARTCATRISSAATSMRRWPPCAKAATGSGTCASGTARSG